MVALLPQDYLRVFEIGCGQGIFREHLSDKNDYWGVEPSPSAANIAKENLDTVLVGTYQEVYDQIPNNYFDLIICNDVIEHMPDHDKFFQSIKKKLSQNGYLIASIPNVRHVGNLFRLLVKKDWQYVGSGILDRTHLRFFTEKSLKRTIKKNGFVIDKFIGIHAYDPLHSLKSDYMILTRILVWFIFVLSTLLFGRDIRFMQFGFRIYIRNNSEISTNSG